MEKSLIQKIKEGLYLDGLDPKVTLHYLLLTLEMRSMRS